MLRIFIVLFSILISTVSIYSQGLKNKKLDSIFTSLENSNELMGSIFITRNNEDVYSNSIGYSDIDSNKKSTSNTKYRIGSITKVYTATLIFQLIDENRLRIDQHLSDFFPKIKNADKITIGDLLSHRSGIFNFTRKEDFNPYESKSSNQMISMIEGFESDFDPNTKTEYSNTNFILLGYILEKIYNKPYAAVLKNQISKPLNLINTYYGSFINIEENEASSYTFSDKWEKSNETHLSLPHGAGAIVSTPKEVVNFINTLMDGKLISEKSLNKMKDITEGMGHGIGQFLLYDKSIYGHNGGIDGFSSLMIYEPQEKIAIAITSNASKIGLRDIVIKGLEEFMGNPFKKIKAIEVSDDYLNNYTGIYESEQAPFTLTFYVKYNFLYGGPTGNHHNQLTHTGENQFILESDGATIVFTPENKGLELTINGNKMQFSKKQ